MTEEKIYLNMTAIPEMWFGSEKDTFLGSWCVRPLHNELYYDVEYDIVEKNYTDEQCQKSNKYIFELTEQIVSVLTDTLNTFHRVNKSHDYWHKILCTWVIYYISTYYARYQEIMNFLEQYKQQFEVKLFKIPEEYMPTSSDGNERFYYNVPSDLKEDFYQHIIYGKILQYLNLDQCTINYIDVPYELVEKQMPSSNGFSKKNVKYFVKKAYERINRNTPIMVLGGVGSNPKKLRKQTIGKVFFSAIDCHIPFENKRNLELRKKINIEWGPENEFEKIIKEQIIFDLPNVCIEGYEHILANCKGKMLHNPKIIIGNPYDVTSEGIVFAEYAERGVQMYGMAHSVGLIRSDSYCLESKRYDKYYVWKTAGGMLSNWLSSPCQKYAEPQEEKYEKKTILWCMDFAPLFRYGGIAYFNSDNYIKEKLRLIKEFVTSIDVDIAKTILYRLRDVAHFGIKEYIEQYNSDIQFDLGVGRCSAQVKGRAISELLYDSRLVIVESWHTSVFFEALIRNVPVIILQPAKDESAFNFDDFEFDRKELEEQGIVFYDAIKAASFVNSIGDIEAWWNEKERQNVIRRIADKYAMHTDDSCEWWRKELNRLYRQC